MTARIRIAVLLISALAVLALGTALVTWWLVDTEQLRERLEAGLEEAMGMDVRIGQPPRFSLLQGVNVILADLEVSSDGQVVASAESASVRLALFSLLSGRVEPLELRLERPELTVVRISQGVFNINGSGAEPGGVADMLLRRLRVSDARIRYLDQASGAEWQFEHCDLDLRNIRHAGGALGQVFATLGANGDLTCRTLSQDRFVVTGLSAELHGENGVFELEPLSATIFDGLASGRIEVDLSSATPLFRLESRLSGFDIGAFMTLLKPDAVTAGKMDFELVLNGQGRTWQEFRQSTAGVLNISAGELTIGGYDLDSELDSYAATQRFNLVDVGAIFLAGPVGLLATRGYAFTGLLHGSGTSTSINQMVSRWTVENGIAQARDVAFRTPENRLALAGALNFNHYRFEDMRVALVDRDGCAVIEQRITGPFLDPEIDRPDFLVSIFGPILDLVERGVKAIGGSDCRIFYTGSIPHPG